MGRSSIDSYDITAESEDSCSRNSLPDDVASSSERGIDSAKSFVRNKVKYEELVLRVQEIMVSRLDRASRNASYTEAVEEEIEVDDILQLLSSLQQTNNQNELTIQNLQRRLVDLTTERDAANKKSHKLTKIMARHRAEYESSQSQERKGCAILCVRHKKEIRKWKVKMRKLIKRCKRNEAELKKRLGLEKKLIDLENTCEKMESELITAKGGAFKRNGSTGTKSTASMETLKRINSDEMHTNLKPVFEEEGKCHDCIPKLIRLPSIELHESQEKVNISRTPTRMKSDGIGLEQAIANMHLGQSHTTVQSLQEENADLNKSIEAIEETLSLVHQCNAKMENFVQDHESSVKDYDSRLVELQTKLGNANKSNKELTSELCSLKDEVEVLARSLEEASASEGCYEQELIDMATLKENACRDKMEAYAACEVLQVEIGLLRKQVMKNWSQDGDIDSNDNRKDMDREASLYSSHNHSTSDYESLGNPKYSFLSSVLSHDGVDDYDDVSDSSIIADGDEDAKTEEEQSLWSV